MTNEEQNWEDKIDWDRFDPPAGSRSGVRTEVGNGEIAVEQEFEYYSVLFSSLVRIKTDGACRRDGEALSVTNATEALVLFSCDTNYRSAPEYMALRRCEITDNVAEPIPHGAVKRLPQERRTMAGRGVLPTQGGVPQMAMDILGLPGGIMRPMEGIFETCSGEF